MAYCPGSVLNLERHNYQTLPFGYGSDTGGGNTDELLEYVVSRFGPVASFSGSYRADSWTLSIHQGNAQGSKLLLLIKVTVYFLHVCIKGCPDAPSKATVSSTDQTSNERDG